MNFSKIVVAIVFILISISFISAEGEQISGDTVFIDTNHAYISATPHTLHESGYVEFTILSKQYTGDIDIYWGFNKLSGYPTHADYWNGNKWNKIPNNYFKQSNFCFGGNHLWYYVEDHQIIVDNEITVRVWMEIKFNTDGKYDFIIKPSHLTFNQSLNDGVLFHLDPWWDSGWSSRDELVLTGNTSGAQTDYPLLVNITYHSEMQPDFDDLRFTDDSQNLLNAWLESKIDSEHAYVWINFSSTPADGVNQTYYMYYNNNIVSNYWNGVEVFQFFDDFEDGDITTGGTVPWSQVSGTTVETNGYLVMNEANEEVSIPCTVNNDRMWEIDFKAIDTTDHDDLNQFKFMVNGGNNNQYRTDVYSNYLYLITGATTLIPVSISISSAFHRYGITRNVSGGFEIFFDNVSKGTGTNLEVTTSTTLQLCTVRSSVSHWDNFKIRKYVEYPATYTIGDHNYNKIYWDGTSNIENIITSDGKIFTNYSYNVTEWDGYGLINNATLIMGTDYNNSTGSFSITDGIIDSITVHNLTSGDLLVLYEGSVPLEIGLVTENKYTFTTNIDVGEYSISTISYDENETGVYGFVYEGLTGVGNPLSNVLVYIYNSTWSDTTITDNGGFYSFIELANTTYTLSFKKDRYNDILYQYVTPNQTDMYYKVIYMQKSTGDYYSRHYCTFTLKNIWQNTYQDVETFVYNNGDIEASGKTGYDGSITFHLFEDVEYRITFVAATQGIDKEIILQPRDNEYTIYVSSYDFTPDNTSIRDTIDYYVTRGDLNLTHGWLNFTYIDVGGDTIFLDWWINDTDGNIINYTNSSYPCNVSSTFTHNIIVNSSNHSYNVHLSVSHPDYPEMQHSWQAIIKYLNGIEIDLGFSEQSHYNILAICIIVLVSLFFGATNVKIGTVIVCLSAWFFVSIGWFGTNAFSLSGLILATILSVFWNLKKGESNR